MPSIVLTSSASGAIVGTSTCAGGLLPDCCAKMGAAIRQEANRKNSRRLRNMATSSRNTAKFTGCNLFRFRSPLRLLRLFEQDCDVRHGGIVRSKALRCFCLEAYAVARESQQLCDTVANRGRVRTNLWRAEDQARIDVGDLRASIAHPFQGLTQENDGVRTLPLRIRRGEQCTDVWSGDRSQQRIGAGM